MVFEELKKIIAEEFSVDEDAITMETAFIGDLGADSLDLVELAMAVEETFDLPVMDESLRPELLTVRDVVDYVTSQIG